MIEIIGLVILAGLLIGQFFLWKNTDDRLDIAIERLSNQKEINKKYHGRIDRLENFNDARLQDQEAIDVLHQFVSDHMKRSPGSKVSQRKIIEEFEKHGMIHLDYGPHPYHLKRVFGPEYDYGELWIKGWRFKTQKERGLK